MVKNIAFKAIKYVFIDLIGDILYWPFWWYSKGLLKTGLFCLTKIKEQEERLGIIIWFKNLFTPMFGQYDIEGRIISFFIRLIQIIARLILLLLWAILMLFLFLSWLVLPILIIYQIINNFIWLIS